jgi:hypothetical protein
MSIDKHVLYLCEKEIQENLGGLEDLPRELANTVANIYYNFFELSKDMMGKKATNPNGWLPTMIRNDLDRGGDWANSLEDFSAYFARVKSDFEAINEMIHCLRGIDETKTPRMWQYTYDFILDCMKYNLKNAHKKNAMRRAIERKIKKKDVDEIPNLIDFLQT